MKQKKMIISATMILFWFSIYAYVPQMTNYAEEMGASYRLIGLIAGAYGFSQTLIRIPIGIMSDKMRNRKIFIMAGILSTILSALIVYLYPNPYVLLAARLLAGVASATWVNFIVLFTNYFKQEESSNAIGIATSNSKIGQLFAMFMGGFVASTYSIRSIFLLSISAGVLSFIAGLFVKEEQIEIADGAAKDKGIFSIAKDKQILKVSILGSIGQLISYATAFGFTPLIASRLGADNLVLSYLSVAYTLPQILFSIIAGSFFVKHMGIKKSLYLGFIILALSCFITPFIQKYEYLYIIQFISGIGNAIAFTILMALVMDNVEEGLKATVMGFYQAVYGVGMIIGPVLLGFVGDTFGLNAGFMLTGLIGVFAIWMVNRLK